MTGSQHKATVFFVILAIAVAFGCSPKKIVSSFKKDIKSFSFKKFPVLEYHVIGYPEARWTRTPENFKSDLEWLYKNNYYPMNLKDILTSFKGLPEGKTPVILTFDDSSSSQFRYLPNGSIDPKCAVGIIKNFHKKHKDSWPMRATFFILVQTNNPDRNIFGQEENPSLKSKKLQALAKMGMEVASHTYSHDRLSIISPGAAKYSLAKSSKELSQLSSQEIVSLATPMGLYPSDESVFNSKYQKIEYNFKLVAEVAGGLEVLPSNPKFNPYHIKRIQTIPSEWEKFFNRRN